MTWHYCSITYEISPCRRLCGNVRPRTTHGALNWALKVGWKLCKMKLIFPFGNTTKSMFNWYEDAFWWVLLRGGVSVINKRWLKLVCGLQETLPQQRIRFTLNLSATVAAWSKPVDWERTVSNGDAEIRRKSSEEQKLINFWRRHVDKKTTWVVSTGICSKNPVCPLPAS